MTYIGVLLIFILPPTLIMAVLAGWKLWRSSRRGYASLHWQPYLVILAHVVVAVIYTTPWDNYLVANRVWWYDPVLVLGLTIGWVPVEEYAFFVLQTLMTGLWTVTIVRTRLDLPAQSGPNPSARRVNLLVVSLAWVLSLAVLLSGWPPGRYLGLILAWGLLPFLVQLLFGGDLLWADWRKVVVAIGVPTLYLWLVDGLAIASGTWTIDPLQTTGLKLGVLPLEEMVFFLMTNVLVVCGITLALSPESKARWQGYLSKLPRLGGIQGGKDALSLGD